MTTVTSDSMYIVGNAQATMDSEPAVLNSELKSAALTLAVFFGFLTLGLLLGAGSGIALQSGGLRLAVSCSGLALSLGTIYGVISRSAELDRPDLRAYSGMVATILGTLAAVLAA